LIVSNPEIALDRIISIGGVHVMTIIPTVESPSISARKSDPGEYEVRKLGISDLREALRLGWADFMAVPTHAVVLAVIYPIAGLLVAAALHGYSLLHYLFPVAAGFALVGPFVALGLYDLSRQRELGVQPTAVHALGVIRSPSLFAILQLGGLLALIFVVWLATAQSIYVMTFGYAPFFSMPAFVMEMLTSVQGQTLAAAGIATGCLYAVVVFCISVISFPFLLDRATGFSDAVLASVRVVLKNPVTMVLWGCTVAAFVIAGSLPFFLGLAVIVPWLGHATWHLYRKAIA
jgi:uncharacterized membrane protein